MKSDNEFRRGLIDGIPIGLAYVAVSFAFGIAGASKGIPVWALTLISATCVSFCRTVCSDHNNDGRRIFGGISFITDHY